MDREKPSPAPYLADNQDPASGVIALFCRVAVHPATSLTGVKSYGALEPGGPNIETFASLNHGDSGGPVFGWWPDGGPYGGDPAGPYIVAVVSGEGTMDPVITDPGPRTGNWPAGGSEMPDLVNQALNDYP